MCNTTQVASRWIIINLIFYLSFVDTSVNIYVPENMSFTTTSLLEKGKILCTTFFDAINYVFAKNAQPWR